MASILEFYSYTKGNSRVRARTATFACRPGSKSFGFWTGEKHNKVVVVVGIGLAQTDLEVTGGMLGDAARVGGSIVVEFAIAKGAAR